MSFESLFGNEAVVPKDFERAIKHSGMNSMHSLGVAAGKLGYDGMSACLMTQASKADPTMMDDDEIRSDVLKQQLRAIRQKKEHLKLIRANKLVATYQGAEDKLLIEVQKQEQKRLVKSRGGQKRCIGAKKNAKRKNGKKGSSKSKRSKK